MQDEWIIGVDTSLQWVLSSSEIKEETERASLQIKNSMFLFQYKGKTHTLDQTIKILKVSTTKKKKFQLFRAIYCLFK